MLGVLALALLVLLLLWDWNWFKRPIESRVEQQTGRRFEIRGDLDVDLGLRPRVVIERPHMANASWGRAREFLSAERADFSIDLLALLSGTLHFPHLELDAPRIELERIEGRANWELAQRNDATDESADEKPGKGLPRIDLLTLRNGHLHFFDPGDNTDVRVAFAEQPGEQHKRLSVRAEGRFRGQALDASALGGAVLSLASREQAYPFNARFRIGSTQGTLDGSVTGLEQLRALRLELDVQGPTLAALHPLTGLSLPETPPYRIVGLLRREDARWFFEDFTGTVGDSDLSGNVAVRYVERRPQMSAVLRSRQLDLDDLAGFVGAAPGTGAGETASAAQQQQARAEEARPRVLPDKPINLKQLRTMDADVRFTAESLRNKKLPLDHLDTHLLLERGVLRLEPLDFGVARGRIRSRVRIDARQDVPELAARLDVTRLDLAQLLPGNTTVTAAAGLIGGRADLHGRGNSTAQLLANLNGEVGVAVRRGEFSHLLIEGIGLDVAEALGVLVSGDDTVRLRCAVADLKAQDGVLRTRSVVIDTTDTKVNIDGSIDLKDERLDLTVHPLPKDFSPLSIRAPLHVRGRFKDPKIRPDESQYIKGGIAAVLGALVTPLAALLPLIETGPGKDEDCGALIAAVERRAPPQKEATP